MRLPRHFGANKVLVPYSHDKAFRQFAVSSTCNAKYSNEHCSYHVIQGDKLYLVTDRRVLCVLVDNLELVWKVSFKSKRPVTSLCSVSLANSCSLRVFPELAVAQKMDKGVLLKEGRPEFLPQPTVSPGIPTTANAQYAMPIQNTTGREYFIETPREHLTTTYEKVQEHCVQVLLLP